jgi:TBC1 domain family member 15
MSDLCAPLYVVAGSDEPLTFWCFVEVMVRMVSNETRGLLERDQTHVHFICQKQNFLRDQSGMKKQLSTLQQLLRVMDPELYRHFEKTEGLNLFFCFR